MRRRNISRALLVSQLPILTVLLLVARSKNATALSTVVGFVIIAGAAWLLADAGEAVWRKLLADSTMRREARIEREVIEEAETVIQRAQLVDIMEQVRDAGIRRKDFELWLRVEGMTTEMLELEIVQGAMDEVWES